MNMDALDLETLPDDQAFKPAPGAMIDGEGLGLSGLFGLEDIDGLAHILRPAAVCDQHCIGHGYGDDVFKADADNLQPFILGAQKGVGAINRRCCTGQGNTAIIACAFAPDRVPTAQIGPARRKRNNDEIVRPLHHSIINGDILASAPGFRIEAGKNPDPSGPA